MGPLWCYPLQRDPDRVSGRIWSKLTKLIYNSRQKTCVKNPHKDSIFCFCVNIIIHFERVGIVDLFEINYLLCSEVVVIFLK